MTHDFAQTDGPTDADGRQLAERLDRLESAIELFQLLARFEEGELPSELRELAKTLAGVADLTDVLGSLENGNPDEQGDVAEFLIAAAETLKPGLNADDPHATGRLDELNRETLERWGDRLEADGERSFRDAQDGWNDEPDDDQAGADPDAGDEIPAPPSADDITRMLAGLASATDPENVSEPESGSGSGDVAELGQEREPENGPATGTKPVATSGDADSSSMLTGELREAFLDDALRCVASLEEASLSLETQPDTLSPLRQILRELHTLKGASASVGLDGLASFIHELEESLRGAEQSRATPNVDALLTSIDTIRRRVDAIASPGQGDGRQSDDAATGSPTSAGNAPATDRGGVPPAPAPSVTAPSVTAASVTAPSAATSPATAPPQRFDEGATDEETVRVRTSQLNRLMDLLSQLVMLRNRRGMELSDLEQIHHQLIHGVSRLRVLGEEGMSPRVALPRAESSRAESSRTEPLAPGPESVSPQLPRITEITNDLFESAQRLRGCFRPVAEGNAAVSQFIRQFRQELVELQRTPVSGLFRRLRRSVRDAARVEGKRVELTWVGEETGIERSLQEKVYEPLLHIVRNCVGHGIETPDERTARGKAAAGRVVLEAHSGPDLLVFEIRDDGRGLDYDAIRRRGLERGLIKPDMALSRDELAQLIFQPGFSTRDVTSELAGRGVGMDVVAATLDRMRGWIQVESETDHGTTIRLNIPLPSVIQHAMVLRSSGQLFALPMQFIRGAGGEGDGTAAIRLADVLAEATPKAPGSPRSDADGQRLVLDCGVPRSAAGGDAGPGSEPNPSEFSDPLARAIAASTRRVTLMVDEIVGPEEVVVRPLPALLKQHPLCTGATLSGMGELVLTLDANAVAALGARRLVSDSQIDSSRPAMPAFVPQPVTPIEPSRPRVLVTDDSLTARKRLTRSLLRYGVEIVEANDGSEALELLRRQAFDAVFSDLEMPNLDGLGMLAEIRGREQTRQLPVVIVSSRLEDEFRDRAEELGVNGYLGKPVDDETLDHAIDSVSVLRAAISPSTSSHPHPGES